MSACIIKFDDSFDIILTPLPDREFKDSEMRFKVSVA
jgi:hypothetical protein